MKRQEVVATCRLPYPPGVLSQAATAHASKMKMVGGRKTVTPAKCRSPGGAAKMDSGPVSRTGQAFRRNDGVGPSSTFKGISWIYESSNELVNTYNYPLARERIPLCARGKVERAFLPFVVRSLSPKLRLALLYERAQALFGVRRGAHALEQATCQVHPLFQAQVLAPHGGFLHAAGCQRRILHDGLRILVRRDLRVHPAARPYSRGAAGAPPAR